MDFAYVSRSTYGAWRLARLDPGGMSFFDVTIEGFWRSFMVALYIAPIYLLSRFADFAAYSEREIEITPFVAGALASYALTWVAFPVAMILVAKAFDLSARYVAFIIAYNWAQMIQMAILLPFILSAFVFEEAPTPVVFIEFLAFLLILYYQWFVARTALAVPGMLAAGVVVLDFSISILMRQSIDALL